MKSLLVRGPILTQSGYGYHSRQFVHWARELERSGRVGRVVTECMPWGMTPWYLNSEDHYDRELIEYSLSHSTETAGTFDATIQIQLPHEWDPGKGKFNIGVTAGVETDRVSQDWIKACLRMDRIIVPSEFSKKAFIDSATDDYDRRRLSKRIHVVREAFHPSLPEETEGEIMQDKVSGLLEGINGKFFLVFGQLTGTDASNDRKNTFNAIKWFVEEYGNDPNVSLIVKTNSARNTTIDRKITVAKLDACVKEAKKLAGVEGAPGVHLLHGALTEREKRAIYMSEKNAGLLMPSRGEGYGLPVLEAVVCGLPVIGTEHSGYMDFVGDALLPVSFDMIQVPQVKIDGRVFVPGCLWAEPHESSCKEQMRALLDSDEHLTRARKSAGAVLRDYSIDSVVADLDSKFTRDMLG